MFGLSPQWLLHDGRPVATAAVLSHPEQLARLAADCPEAVPTAVLAGDPCYDRILAALPQRERFRRALGVTPGQRLVVVTSTWSPRSLFGDGDPGGDLLPWLLPRLTAELPADEYRVAAVLHPNIWYGHGPGQLRAWLERARDAGLTLVPPLDGWRQALIAADCVLGDQGSVTYYAAAVGRPVLLGAFPADGLDPRSPVAAFGRSAPRLRASGSLRAQVERAVDGYDPAGSAEPAALTSSAPGRSAALLRALFYRLIGLPEPAGRPALLDPLPLPPFEPAVRTAAVRVLTRTAGDGPPAVAVTRYADAPYEPDDPAADAAHTVVNEDTRDAGRLRIADVVVRYAAGPADDPRTGPPAAWAADALARYPQCALAAVITRAGECTIRTRPGDLLRLTAAPDTYGRPDLCDPAAYASALHAWLSAGRAVAPVIASGLTVVTGSERHHVTVQRLADPRG